MHSACFLKPVDLAEKVNHQVQTFALLECNTALTDSYRRFGTEYRFHIQGSTIEARTDRLLQNICNCESTPRNNSEEQIHHLHSGGILRSRTLQGLLILRFNLSFRRNTVPKGCKIIYNLNSFKTKLIYFTYKD
jgi:hypothetical protein